MRRTSEINATTTCLPICILSACILCLIIHYSYQSPSLSSQLSLYSLDKSPIDLSVKDLCLTKSAMSYYLEYIGSENSKPPADCLIYCLGAI